MRIAIMGAGSMGTILGAYIAKSGTQIDLIDANVEHVNALNENGAKITGTVEFTTPVKALTPDEMEGIYDFVFYMVKQTYNEAALGQLLSHLDENSTVCTLQNGMPEEAVAKIIGTERTIGGTIGWGATWLEPGVSALTSSPDKLTFDVGELNGQITERLKYAKEMLEKMCPTEILENLLGIRWTKLMVNATFSGMSAALGCTFGDVLDDEKALLCVKHIANECIDVAKAKGVKMEDIQGFDLGTLLAFKTEEERDSKDPVYHKMWGPHRKLKASMLQDLEKGRKCEIDAINGVVCESGDEIGIDTPVNDMVVEIVKGIQDKKYECKFSNLEMFEIPKV
jgi:2-dehydropantoate 2-reductase